MSKKDDTLYQDEYEPAGFRWMSIAVVILAVSGFVALAWYAYNAGQHNMRVEDVLIVKAEQAPTKIVPVSPGGAEFKHKDKEIYDALDPSQKKPEKTQALPKTEAPKRPELIEKPVKVQAVAQKPKPATVKEEVTSYVSPIPKAEQSKTLINPDPYSPVEEKKPDPIVQAVKKAEQKSADVKGHSVQLGAFGSEEEAQANWAKIRRSHLDVLDTESHKIVKADLGAKGVFYRLRVTGLASKEAAGALCKTLSARKQGCFYSGKL